MLYRVTIPSSGKAMEELKTSSQMIESQMTQPLWKQFMYSVLYTYHMIYLFYEDTDPYKSLRSQPKTRNNPNISHRINDEQIVAYSQLILLGNKNE